MKNLFLLLIISFALACTYKITDNAIPEDRIIAFGLIKDNVSDIEKNSLIMFGDQLNYVISAHESSHLLKILNAGLSKRYKIGTDDKFHITMREDNSFSHHFCLMYEVEHIEHIENERKKLIDLGFSANKNFPNRYSSCMDVHGKVYAKNSNDIIPRDYQFKTPIEIQLRRNQKVLDARLLAAPIIAPLFIVGHVMLLPVMVVGALSGAKIE